MKSCTFFGHRDTPNEVELSLRTVIIDLIENSNVRFFYVGNQGNFDRMVQRQLSLLEVTHEIKYYIIMAYYPKQGDSLIDNKHSIYPEGMEIVPLKYAIYERNLRMLEKSDYVITYVRGVTGGAAHFKLLAEKKGKTVIAL